MYPKHILSTILICLLFASPLAAQQKKAVHYNSLLWEISGNGLARPSYVFGTMHVSSKLAFHLSDSFYYALKQVDAVALELNPELWQGQMVRLGALNENYSNYVQQGGNDFLNENSFRIKKYEASLQSALSTEPPVVNSLLYRSYKAREDFEEDTFLDLYIFQTGRKLGKAAAGVEDYYESEKLVMEAYADMAREKKKKEIDLEGESMASLVEKMQNAYRRGDLDLMDSLDNMMEKSPAFREKFLYKRNEIQANSIDSIIRKTALFAGVGAAHLPGERGVIALLRQKGYTLRPIKMSDRDANQKEQVDQLKVKVTFSTQQAADGAFSVDVPGKLYSLRNAYQPLNRWQYADMNNGSYYLVTRVKTYAAFTGTSSNEVLKKVDSVLYENIPGKILSKKIIEKDGYRGYDISNRTRRGDLQRYQVFATPFEIIIFKMSGKNNYVNGEEAARFFSSIRLYRPFNAPLHFTPAQGGFGIKLPQQPHQYLDNISEDRWEYEAVDTATGDAYLIFKKSIYNFQFIEEDSFDLGLLEESFRSPDYFEKQLSRSHSLINGIPVLLTRELLKNGQVVQAAFLLQGPHYYIVAKRAARGSDSSFAFLNTFRWQPYRYGLAATYTDTFLRFSLSTPVRPLLDEGIRSIIERTAADAANGFNYSGYISYWQKVKNGLFRSDSTGEMVSVQVQEYPRYYYIRDSAKFWRNEIDDFLNKNDMLLKKVSPVSLPGNTSGYHFIVQDTGSSRQIERLIILKDKYFYTISTVTDTLGTRSAFLQSIFNSFTALPNKTAVNLYESKLPLFFKELFSPDSAELKKAQQSVSNVYFGSGGAAGLYDAINRISLADKDYFNLKSKLIAELGYISDSVNNEIPVYLTRIYQQTADTSLFQHEVVKALSRLKTAASFQALKEIMLQDPPIFDDNDQYESIFDNLQDTLQLSAGLFPELLQLAALADYKEPVTKLLVALVDSGFIQSRELEKYFATIYIDAKVALKKQQSKEEKKMQADKKREGDKEEEEDNNRIYPYNNNRFDLDDYAVLLMPFYDKQVKVQQYFSKLLQSKDDYVRMDAAVLMLRNNKEVEDSIFLELATDDNYRGTLYYKLERAKRLDKFPAGYKNQLSLARSYMVQNSDTRLDSVVFIDKTPAGLKGRKGLVYFFKYRVKKTDDWKIGLSGLQPLNGEELSSNDDLSVLTDKKLKPYDPVQEQFNRQLKILLFTKHKSARNFFNSDDGYNNFKYLMDAGD